MFMLCVLPNLLVAQPGHLLSGLLNFSPQANFFQPAYAPRGSFFVGLPVVSRVSLLASNSFSYQDVFLSERDPLELLHTKNNSLGIGASVGIFLAGYKSPREHYVSLFANQRLETFLYYPKDLVQLLWKGNASSVGQIQDFKSLQTEVLAYQEIGLGYSLPVSRKLRLGAHLKYLFGLVNLSMPTATEANLQIDSDTYVHAFSLKDWRVRSSNLPLDSAIFTNNKSFDSREVVSMLEDKLLMALPMTDDFIMPNNRGLAIDLGVSYDISPLLNVSAALRDIGFISWRDRTYSYTVENEYTTLGDLNLSEEIDLDSLRRNLESNFSFVADTSHYNSTLHASLFSTFSWRLSRDNYLSASHMLQRLPSGPLGRFHAYYSVSYMRHLGQHVSASVSLLRQPQHTTLGMAFVYNVGVFQLYGALGNALGLLNVPGMRMVDINLGINIITGRPFKKYRKSARLCP